MYILHTCVFVNNCMAKNFTEHVFNGRCVQVKDDWQLFKGGLIGLVHQFGAWNELYVKLT